MRAVIYGLGWLFSVSKERINSNEIAYYCDKKKRGKRIDGIDIIGLEELKSIKDYDVIYVTTTEKWWREVVDDLMSIGVHPSKIRFPLYERFSISVDNDGTIVGSCGEVSVALKCQSDFLCFDADFIEHEYGVNIFFDNTVVFDIGMNSATTALYFASLKNVKRVYGFEPFLDTYNNALENINRNPNLAHKIIPMNFALASREAIEEVPIFEDDNTGARTTFEEFYGNSSYVQGRPELRREMITYKNARSVLEKLIEEEGTEHYLLKIDVEGSEFDIFKILENSYVLDDADVIMMEFHREPHYLIEVLESKGFYYMKKQFSENQGLIFAFNAK